MVLHSTSARSQGERAYLLIRDQIVTLQLAPGSVIEEAKLRQELGLGRTPIREALQRLAHENLVSFVPHRGTFVCDINLTDLHRLTEVRVEMEGYAARLAAERAAAADRAAMEALMAELETIDETDVRSLMRLDQQIHRQVYQATRNAFLQAMLEESFQRSNAIEGGVVEGIVVAIEKDVAVIDVGLKTEGRVALREFAGPGRGNEVKVGGLTPEQTKTISAAGGI